MQAAMQPHITRIQQAVSFDYQAVREQVSQMGTHASRLVSQDSSTEARVRAASFLSLNLLTAMLLAGAGYTAIKAAPIVLSGIGVTAVAVFLAILAHDSINVARDMQVSGFDPAVLSNTVLVQKTVDGVVYVKLTCQNMLAKANSPAPDSE